MKNLMNYLKNLKNKLKRTQKNKTIKLRITTYTYTHSSKLRK